MTMPEPLARPLSVVMAMDTTDGSTCAATATYEPGTAACTGTAPLPEPTVTDDVFAGASSRPANTPPTAPTSEQATASVAMPAYGRLRPGPGGGGGGGRSGGGVSYGVARSK